MSQYYKFGIKNLNTLETIPILRQHIQRLFLTHPLCQHKYSTERQQKLLFSEPTQSFCFKHKIGMVPYLYQNDDQYRIYKSCQRFQPINDILIISIQGPIHRIQNSETTQNPSK